MSEQFVVVTGANRGIGLALTKEYLRRGCEVLALCRKASEALRETKAALLTGIDVADAATMPLIQEHLGTRTIDILINNAGILHSECLGVIDFTQVTRQLEVNSVAPLRVTETLLDNLQPGSKVALITSRMGSITDNESGGYYGYRMSKAALNSAGMSLSHDLKPKGVAVAILHPGFVQTDMVANAGDVSPQSAAENLIHRIDELSLENSGTFWHASGEVLPW
ncbi:MAG: SDR family oxidoreductase [Cellvibrionaceae bacterium]|nr:SDR family oxidoreductase [Cellvibrionaceae bacterium]